VPSTGESTYLRADDDREAMMSRMQHEEGATAAEYAIMVGLIAAVIVTSVFLIGASTRQLFCDTARSYPGSTADC
jgi:pilus assembly protein Flp/PilA